MFRGRVCERKPEYTDLTEFPGALFHHPTRRHGQRIGLRWLSLRGGRCDAHQQHLESAWSVEVQESGAWLVHREAVLYESRNRNEGSGSRLDRLASRLERAVALKDVQPLIARMGMCAWTADAHATNLFDEAKIAICQKAARKRHPQVVDEPESGTVLIRQDVGRSGLIHARCPRSRIAETMLTPILAASRSCAFAALEHSVGILVHEGQQRVHMLAQFAAEW